jgi:hypothetical protein
MFPTIFRIAMDYLPIQSSAVPCEHIFSSSAETDTKKRSRIKPELMEALQILKFALKKDRLNFTGHLHLPEFMLIPSDDKRTELSKMLDMDVNKLTAHLDSVDFAD